MVHLGLYMNPNKMSCLFENAPGPLFFFYKQHCCNYTSGTYHHDNVVFGSGLGGSIWQTGMSLMCKAEPQDMYQDIAQDVKYILCFCVQISQRLWICFWEFFFFSGSSSYLFVSSSSALWTCCVQYSSLVIQYYVLHNWGELGIKFFSVLLKHRHQKICLIS